MERNQAQEIYNYLKANPDSNPADIAQGSGWNRSIVEVALLLMSEAGLIEETGRTEWGDPTFRAKSRDRQTLEEWQEAVDYAHVLILLNAARACGLVTGGPEVDVARCEDILARGRERGVTPAPDAIERIFIAQGKEGP